MTVLYIDRSMRKYSNGSIVENSLGKVRRAVFAHPEGGLLELRRTHLMTSDASKTAVRSAKNATVDIQTSEIYFVTSASAQVSYCRNLGAF